MAETQEDPSVPAESFVEALSDDDRAFFKQHAKVEHYAPGEVIIQYGTKSDRVVLVEKGTVKVIVSSYDGRDSVLALRGPKDVLGELSAVDGQSHVGSVVALDSVHVTSINNDDFRELLSRSPEAANWLLKRIVEHFRESARGRAEFGLADTTSRVAARLVQLADRYGYETGEGVLIDLPFTQGELAAWVGATRKSVTRVLHLFRELDWVHTERRFITIRNIDALRERALNPSAPPA